MRYLLLSKSSVLFLLYGVLLLSCQSKTDDIRFVVIDQNYRQIIISEKVNHNEIEKFFNQKSNHSFSKLILEQSNGEDLIIEQKNREGYLVLITLGYEQFLIEEQPQTIKEVEEIMLLYASTTDKIMSQYKFY